MEKTKDVFWMTVGALVLGAIVFSWVKPLFHSKENSVSNVNSVQTKSELAISHFKEKYGAKDNWQSEQYTIQLQDDLIKNASPIVFKASVTDVYKSGEDTHIRAYIPSYLSLESDSPYFFDLKCNQQEMISKILLNKPDVFSTDYVIVAKVLSLSRPDVMFKPSVPEPDDEPSVAVIDVSPSQVYTLTGECVDLALTN